MGKIITLTTDFGTRDPYVGAMKGVILSLCPGAQVVDITHEVQPFDLLGGALALAGACDYFPKGTVHLAVVDPGVGTQRKAVAVQAGDYHFVGPDNGVLSLAVEISRQKDKNSTNFKVVELRNQRYMLEKVSATFHGRDVFAPAAAHLANGISLPDLGPEVKTLEKLILPQVRKTKGGLEGEVIGFDRFGNGITNISRQMAVGRRQRAKGTIQVKGKTIALAETYGNSEKGEPVALWGSCGFLEIAVNQGSAQKVLGLMKGTRVFLKERLK